MSELFRIKTLNWQEEPSTNGEQWRAYGCLAHSYWVRQWNPPNGLWAWKTPRQDHWHDAPSLTAAKAACQADHEARLCEHLEPVQDAPDDTNRLVAIVKNAWRIENRGSLVLVRDYNNYIVGEDIDFRAAIDAAMVVKP